MNDVRTCVGQLVYVGDLGSIENELFESMRRSRISHTALLGVNDSTPYCPISFADGSRAIFTYRLSYLEGRYTILPLRLICLVLLVGALLNNAHSAE